MFKVINKDTTTTSMTSFIGNFKDILLKLIQAIRPKLPYVFLRRKKESQYLKSFFYASKKQLS